MNESFAAVLALPAVRGVDALLAQEHRYTFQRPALSPGVKCRRHRDATAKRRPQQSVRIRSGIFTALRARLVGYESAALAVAHFVLQLAYRYYCDVTHRI